MNHDRIEQLKTFLKEEPNDPFLQYSLALEYLKIEQNEAALTIFEDLLLNHADYLATYYHCGKLQEKLNKKEKAIACYEKGILLARKQNHSRTLREINEALNSLRFEE